LYRAGGGPEVPKTALKSIILLGNGCKIEGRNIFT
jgi:hypothetical protein